MNALNRNPSPRELAWFGALLPVFFGLVAWLLYREGTPQPITTGLLGSGLTLSLVLALVPRWRTPVYVTWMRAVFPIGWLVSHGLLAVIYFLVVTPIGWLLRLTGRDPLHRRIDRSAPTYWLARPRTPAERQYFRQY